MITSTIGERKRKRKNICPFGKVIKHIRKNANHPQSWKEVWAERKCVSVKSAFSVILVLSRLLVDVCHGCVERMLRTCIF